MGTTLTVCKGCLRQAEQDGEEASLRCKVDALRDRIELQIGPVELQVEECLHHCLSHEVCVRLQRTEAGRPGWAHLKLDPGFVDPVSRLLGT